MTNAFPCISIMLGQFLAWWKIFFFVFDTIGKNWFSLFRKVQHAICLYLGHQSTVVVPDDPPSSHGRVTPPGPCPGGFQCLLRKTSSPPRGFEQALDSSLCVWADLGAMPASGLTCPSRGALLPSGPRKEEDVKQTRSLEQTPSPATAKRDQGTKQVLAVG